MDRKNSIMLLLFSLFLVLASYNSMAVKPVAQTSLQGLTIVYAKVDYFEYGYSDKFGFHVYNSTNYLVNNETLPLTTCEVHLVDNTGKHLFQGNATYDDARGWYIPLPSNITDKQGTYGYIIDCQNSQEAGFASDQIQIAQVGADQAQFPVGISIVLGVFFLFLVFLAAYFTLQKHVLSYLFMLLTFLVADILIWLNWRMLTFQASPIAHVFFSVFLGMCLITFVMFVVTFLDILRVATNMHKKKEAEQNITRFGYS